ncbi:rod shape-determining protein MreD [Erythrobacter sp. W53]|uniref:rod shape-determining protein MreD n=1 Tax=Erythrobacteraceae TaxID=335929 RepID=UPI0036D21A09
MEALNPRSRKDAYGNRINRRHSTLLAVCVPWITILLGSLLPQFFLTSALPLIPPLGFIMLIAWRLVRPGLMPIWAGFPLGAFDDLFSGQPFGSAILLWSLALIAIEVMDQRLPWRNFPQDWFSASITFSVYAAGGFLISGALITLPAFIGLGPQLLLSILLFPVAARIVAWLDRLRLTRWRAVS